MDFKALTEHVNQVSPFASYLGIVSTKIELGYAETELTVRPELLNPMQMLHGGCLYTLADIAVGNAAVSYGYKSVTVSGEYQYLSSVKGSGKVKAVARCLKRGKTILPFDVEIFDQDGTLVGKGAFTAFCFNERVPLPENIDT